MQIHQIIVQPIINGHFFSRQWWKTTLVVILAVGVCIRLGIWQLDRLERRREFNTRVEAQVKQAPLILEGNALEADLDEMEYRQVIVIGEYDQNGEVALRNQAWDNLVGIHLITPLRIANSEKVVLVNRGWIPLEDFVSNNWSMFQESGQVRVEGIIRRSQSNPEIGWRKDVIPDPGEAPLKAWNMVNVTGIDSQLPYDLLPIYIQQAPDPAWRTMPYRSLPKFELTEGPHLGYAIQWFLFASILGIGYPFYIRKEEAASKAREQTKEIKSSSLPKETARYYQPVEGNNG